MRTESDLRDAIDVLADEGAFITAFHEFATHREVRQRRTSPVRVLAPVVAALVVAAVVVAGFAVRGGHPDGGGTPSAGTKPVPLAWRFAVRDIPGYTITRTSIFRPSFPAADVVEGAAVMPRKGRAGGGIEFDSVPATVVETKDSHTVHGVRYYFRAGRHVTRQGGLTRTQYADPWKAVSQDAHGPELTWQLPDGAQFSVSGSFGFRPRSYDYDNAVARRVMMRIALAVRAGRHDAVTMPFRITGLRHGLVPVGLDLTNAACMKYARPRHPSPLTPPESLLYACRVRPVGSRQHTLDGIAFDSDVIGRHYVRRLPDGTLLAVGVPAGRSGLFSRAQLRGIAERADVTPTLAKPHTWVRVR